MATCSFSVAPARADVHRHTSVVVFGREIFYGQGIMEARPGTTHHGQPFQVIDCGTTHIDSDTFQEYLVSLDEAYTPQKYHLLDFNCNHFTADVIGFLTGREIPSWISGLPAEFLSTPFGQAMRPQIDAMFRQSAPTEHRINGAASLPTPPDSTSPSPGPSMANSLLSAVAAQATQAQSPTPPVSANTAPASPLSLVTSVTHFASILKQNTAVIANFTNTPSCAPCRAIKPVYESLAVALHPMYAAKSVAFVEIELGVGEGQRLASQYKVQATPTFLFFRNGSKVDEMKGATKRELETRVETFLEDSFPRHRHRKVFLPTVEKLPTAPITSANLPAYPALLSKLESFGAPSDRVKILREEALPLLEGKPKSPLELDQALRRWTEATTSLLGSLQPDQTFPVIDLWRVGLLQPRISAQVALGLQSHDPSHGPIDPILSLVASTLSSSGAATPKPFLLTALRFLTNLLAPLTIASLVLASSAAAATLQERVMVIAVESLLHADTAVRSAAAGVAFNMAAYRHRAAKERNVGPEELETEWDVELCSALLEGISREEDEDVAHRLLAALALLLYLSPGYEGTLQPLLEVMGSKDTLQQRSKVYKKKEVKKLAEEIAAKMC